MVYMETQMINPKTMLKQELVDYLSFRCEHRQDAFRHPACYKKWLDAKKPQRYGFLDIESGGSLSANWGQVLCWRIKELDGKIFGDQITPEEVTSKDKKIRIRDKRIIESFCDTAPQFTRLIVYYGKDQKWRHDLPFLRTRAVKLKIDTFPIWKQIEVQDVYDIIKGKFKLTSNSLAMACTVFDIPHKGTKVGPDDWLDALGGIQETIDKICCHCSDDVVSTEALWKRVIKYKQTKTST